MIAIIDYGAGNIFSVKNALDYLGLAGELTSDPERSNSQSRCIDFARRRGIPQCHADAARQRIDQHHSGRSSQETFSGNLSGYAADF